MARDKPDDQDGVPRLRKNEERPTSLSTPIPRERLNKDLQKIVDQSEDYLDQVYEGEGMDTTDTSFRYAAYANRLRTIMISASRYVAYTSDIGESFRPVAHPYLVRGAYAVSWAYLIGDVSNEGYKAYKRNQAFLHPEKDEYKNATEVRLLEDKPGQEPEVKMGRHIPALEDYRTIMAQRAVFQSIASMGLPAFTIHSIVKYSGKAFKNVKNTTLRTWGPIGLGLAAVPFLPYMFDKPVEEAVEWTFYNAMRAVGGPEAVGDRSATGRQELLKARVKEARERLRNKIEEKRAKKDKEL